MLQNIRKLTGPGVNAVVAQLYGGEACARRGCRWHVWVGDNLGDGFKLICWKSMRKVKGAVGFE